MSVINSTKSNVYEALSIGDIANVLIQSENYGRITGITSGGVYILFTDKKLVFFTSFPFRSPITINLGDHITGVDRLNSESQVFVSDQTLIFPRAEFTITTQNAGVWYGSRPGKNIKSQIDIISNLKALLRLAQLVKPSGILADLLTDISEENGNYSESFRKYLWDYFNCKYLLDFEQPFTFIDLLTQLIGLGEGLTPNGDDLIIGFLLAANRWDSCDYQSNKLGKFNNTITKAAYERTTLISANLIELASSGRGDERLTNSIDWIMSGEPEDIQSALPILSWGNTSGIFALAGMAAAVFVNGS